MLSVRVSQLRSGPSVKGEAGGRARGLGGGGSSYLIKQDEFGSDTAILNRLEGWLSTKSSAVVNSLASHYNIQ